MVIRVIQPVIIHFVQQLSVVFFHMHSPAAVRVSQEWRLLVSMTLRENTWLNMFGQLHCGSKLFQDIRKKVSLPTTAPKHPRGGQTHRPLLFHHCARRHCALGKQQPRKTRFRQQRSRGDEETSLRGQQSHPLAWKSVNGHKQRQQPWNAIWRSMRMHFVRQRRRERKHERFWKILHTVLLSERQKTLDQRSKPSKNTPVSQLKETDLHSENVLISTKRCFQGLCTCELFQAAVNRNLTQWPLFDTTLDFINVKKARVSTIQHVFNSSVKFVQISFWNSSIAVMSKHNLKNRLLMWCHTRINSTGIVLSSQFFFVDFANQIKIVSQRKETFCCLLR